MKTPLAVALLLAVASPAAAQSDPAFNIMGPASCAKWPKAGAITSASKAVPLNWVLGFLSGRVVQSNPNLLGAIDPSAVGDWLDAYCQGHPMDAIPTAAQAFEQELEARVAPPPVVQAEPPPVVQSPSAPAKAQAESERSAKPKPKARRRPAAAKPAAKPASASAAPAKAAPAPAKPAPAAPAKAVPAPAKAAPAKAAPTKTAPANSPAGG